MPANPSIGGNKYFDVLVPQWTTIPYSVVGYAFSATAAATAATTAMAGTIGIRKDAHVQITGLTRVDASGREQTDGYETKIELDSWQTDAPSFWNIYQLSKQNVQLAPRLASGDWFNFVENLASPPFAGTTASPNGSTALGMEWEYSCGMKDATNKLMFSGRLHPLEYDWMLANTTTLSTVGSGGIATVGLSGMAYNQANYGIPGINSFTLSGDNIGLYGEDVKVTLKSMAPLKDFRERPLNKFIEVEIDAKALQGRYYDLQNFTAKRNADFTTTIVLWTGITLTFVNSLSFVGSPDFSDSKAEVPFKMKGKIAYDPNGVQTNIAYDGASTFTLTRSTYNP